MFARAKGAKFVLNLVLASLAAALTLLLVLRFSPPLQTSLLEAKLADREEAVYDFRALQAGFGHVQLQDFFALVGNQGLQIKDAKLHGSVWRWWRAGDVVITQGQLKGVFLDLSQLQATQAANLFPEITSLPADPRHVEPAVDRWLHVWVEQAMVRNQHISIENLTLEGQLLLPRQPPISILLEIEHLSSEGARLWTIHAG